MMEFAPGFRAKNRMRKHFHDAAAAGGGIVGSDLDTLLVIKFSDSLVLRIICRSFLLAMVIIALPCIGPIFEGPSVKYVDDYESGFGSDLIDFEFLNMFLRDCIDEGLIKRGDKALVSISGIERIHDLQLLKENGLDVVIIREFDDKENQSLIVNESFDLAFISNSRNVDFTDRAVKTGGIVAVLLGNCPSKNEFLERSNYEILYLPRFSFTIVAMMKSGPGSELVNSATMRHLCTMPSLAEEVALNGLKNPVANRNKYMKKTNKLSYLLFKDCRAKNFHRCWFTRGKQKFDELVD